MFDCLPWTDKLVVDTVSLVIKAFKLFLCTVDICAFFFSFFTILHKLYHDDRTSRSRSEPRLLHVTIALSQSLDISIHVATSHAIGAHIRRRAEAASNCC